MRRAPQLADRTGRKYCPWVSADPLDAPGAETFIPADPAEAQQTPETGDGFFFYSDS